MLPAQGVNTPQITVFKSDMAQRLRPHREAVMRHEVYENLRTADDVRVFMKYHIYAVWDFMSLLKELQRRFTNTARIWHPKPNARLCRMINEIVLGEEADALPDGRVISHYDLYVQAMKEAGAWNREFEDFYDFSTVSDKLSVPQLAPNPFVERFLTETFKAIDRGTDHELAAYFFVGREALIPDMFLKVIERLNGTEADLDTLIIYLRRHVEVDGDEHGPLAERILDELCGSDESRWMAAARSAATALEARKILWDGALSEIRSARSARPDGRG